MIEIRQAKSLPTLPEAFKIQISLKPPPQRIVSGNFINAESEESLNDLDPTIMNKWSLK